MPYSIETKDGIEIKNIPDDIPSDSDILKQRILELRQQRGGDAEVAPIPVQADKDPALQQIEDKNQALVNSVLGPEGIIGDIALGVGVDMARGLYSVAAQTAGWVSSGMASDEAQQNWPKLSDSINQFIETYVPNYESRSQIGGQARQAVQEGMAAIPEAIGEGTARLGAAIGTGDASELLLPQLGEGGTREHYGKIAEDITDNPWAQAPIRNVSEITAFAAAPPMIKGALAPLATAAAGRIGAMRAKPSPTPQVEPQTPTAAPQQPPTPKGPPRSNKEAAEVVRTGDKGLILEAMEVDPIILTKGRVGS